MGGAWLPRLTRRAVRCVVDVVGGHVSIQHVIDVHDTNTIAELQCVGKAARWS